jgi:hypothetical protein
MSQYEDDNYWATLYKMDAKQYRREASKVISMANKRISRLEKSNLTDSPAYAKLVDSKGNPKFSVKGLDHNQLQSEMSKVKKFVQAKTSTVRGINTTLKEMASNTGIKYKNLKELRSKASSFFNLASKVEQYLRNVEDVASAIGYQKIWEAINQYVKSENADFDEVENSVEGLTDIVDGLLNGFEKGDVFTMNNDDDGFYFLG